MIDLPAVPHATMRTFISGQGEDQTRDSHVKHSKFQEEKDDERQRAESTKKERSTEIQHNIMRQSGPVWFLHVMILCALRGHFVDRTSEQNVNSFNVVIMF